jgi:hypothetical protein
LDEWKEWRRVMEAHAATARDRVTLNVGGKLFCTSKATLLAHEGTFFFHMISSGVWQPDEQGQYFIDRNPRQFGHILDCLRGQLDMERLEEMPPAAIAQLKCEADFYQLDELKMLLQAADWFFCPASVPPSFSLANPFGPTAPFAFAPTGSTSGGISFGHIGPVGSGHSPSASSGTSGPSPFGFSFGIPPRPQGTDAAIILGNVPRECSSGSCPDRWATGDPGLTDFGRKAFAVKERQFHIAVSSVAFSGPQRWEIQFLAFRDRTKVKVGVAGSRPIAGVPLTEQPDLRCVVMDLLGRVTKFPPSTTHCTALARNELQPGDRVGLILRRDSPDEPTTLTFEFKGQYSEPVAVPGAPPFYAVLQLGEVPDAAQVLRFIAAPPDDHPVPRDPQG